MRAGRLVRLLGLLQAHGRMTAGQLAGELEVSVRTVLRDIEALSEAGVPVYPVRGPAGGFELLGGYRSELSLAESRLRDRPSTAAGQQRAKVLLSPRGRRLAVLLGRPAGIRVRRGAQPVPGREDWVQAWIRIDSVESAVLEMLALGPEIEVLSPPALRDQVGRAARRLAELNCMPAPDQRGIPSAVFAERTPR